MKYGFILVITEFSLNIKIIFIYRTSSIRDRNKIIQVNSIILAHIHIQVLQTTTTKHTPIWTILNVWRYIFIYNFYIDWIFTARSRMHSATGDKSQEQDTGTCTSSADTVTESKIKPRSRWASKLFSCNLK